MRGRDIGSFVDAVRALFDAKKLTLPAGYRVEFGGQFENLERARNRLLIVVPLSLFLIFLLLFSTFNSLRRHSSSSRASPSPRSAASSRSCCGTCPSASRPPSDSSRSSASRC